jgi:hypothetical protein
MGYPARSTALLKTISLGISRIFLGIVMISGVWGWVIGRPVLGLIYAGLGMLYGGIRDFGREARRLRHVFLSGLKFRTPIFARLGYQMENIHKYCSFEQFALALLLHL